MCAASVLPVVAYKCIHSDSSSGVPVVPVQPVGDYRIVTPDSLTGTLNNTPSSSALSFHLPHNFYITVKMPTWILGTSLKFDLEGEDLLSLQPGLDLFSLTDAYNPLSSATSPLLKVLDSWKQLSLHSTEMMVFV